MQASPVDVTSLDPLRVAAGAAINTLTDKKGLTAYQALGILAPVVLGPGLSYVISYLNGAKRVADRRRQLESYQAALALLDQAAALSAQSEKYDALFGDKRASIMADKILKDAYETFRTPDPQFHFYERTHYSFLMIRQLPIIVRYYVIAMPMTPPAGILSFFYYVLTMISSFIYGFLIYMSATDPSINGDLFLRFLLMTTFSIAAAPVAWCLTRFWRTLFDLRRHYEDALAGVVVNGPAVAIERTDVRIGAATPASIKSRFGRPAASQASPDGGVTLIYSTTRRRSWLWPIPILGRLTGMVVALFARGAVLDIVTDGFDFGADGLLTATWVSRSRPAKAAKPATADGSRAPA